MSGIYAPLINLPGTPYALEVTESGSTKALAALRGECEGVIVRKEISVDDGQTINVRYEVGADGPQSSVAFARR